MQPLPDLATAVDGLAGKLCERHEGHTLPLSPPHHEFGYRQQHTLGACSSCRMYLRHGHLEAEFISLLNCSTSGMCAEQISRFSGSQMSS